MVDDPDGIAVQNTGDSPVVAARIQRIDAPSPGMLALTLGGAVRGVLLVGLDADARGVGLVARRPRGDPASAFVRKLRKTLEGGRIVAFRHTRGELHLEVVARGIRHTLQFELSGRRGNAWLLDAASTVLSTLRGVEPGSAGRVPRESAPLGESAALPELERAGSELLERWATARHAALQAPLSRALARAGKRLQRRLDAIEADRARAGEAGPLRARASLVLANLHRLDPNARTVELDDTSLAVPARVRLEFSPGLGPRQQAERWFERARKLERGARIAEERAELTRRELAQIDELVAAVEAASDAEALEALSERVRAAGFEIPTESTGGRHRHGRRLPYRTFVGSDGRPILVGRGATDNDRLTTQHARPQDLWLHARDTGGAHVVVPLDRGESCPPALLADAATLAAHFSQGRGEPRVDVSYVERRYVRKPRKAPPGTVLLDREKVIRLELEPNRLARLLSSERSRHGG